SAQGDLCAWRRRAAPQNPRATPAGRSETARNAMTARARVGLLVTCLADMFRPEIGFAAVKLLQHAGCDVEVPSQSCCGQPAYNAGNAPDAAAIAKHVIAAFESFDYLVVPSGSCGGMVKLH